MVIFTMESRVAIDRPAEWDKEWILSYIEVPVAKRTQQRDGSVMI